MPVVYVEDHKQDADDASRMWASFIAVAFIWTVFTILCMLHFCHEVNLKMGIMTHDYAEKYVERAQQLKAQGKTEDAKLYEDEAHKKYAAMYERFDNSRRLYPLEMETLYILGRYCIDNDNSTKGVQVLRQDLILNPNYKWGHNNLGVCYDRLGDTNMARESYHRALLVDKYQIYAHFNLGIGYVKEGKVTKAIPELKATIESNPEKYSAYKYLGYAYEQLGEHREALKAFDSYADGYKRFAPQAENAEVSEVSSEISAIAREQLKIALAINDPTAEEKYLSKMVELDPKSTKYRKVLINLLQKLGLKKKLEYQLHEMLKYSPEDPLAWYNVALLDAASGNMKDMLASMTKAVSKGGQAIKDQVSKDQTFDPYREIPEFKQIMGAQ